jgi:putative transposase
MEGMSSKRYTQEQILKVLKEIEDGATIASVGRAHGVGVQTIYDWRRRYAGMGRSELAELKSLQEENRRLKRIVANQAMDIDAYKELAKGKW